MPLIALPALYYNLLQGMQAPLSQLPADMGPPRARSQRIYRQHRHNIGSLRCVVSHISLLGSQIRTFRLFGAPSQMRKDPPIYILGRILSYNRIKMPVPLD